MRRLAPCAALVLLALAGCASPADQESGAEDQDPDLLLVQAVDLQAVPARACPPAASGEGQRIDVPAGARSARFEATYAGTGNVALDVAREGGARVGYAAGASPVAVTLDEGALAGADALVLQVYACDGAPEGLVRVHATFRASP